MRVSNDRRVWCYSKLTDAVLYKREQIPNAIHYRMASRKLKYLQVEHLWKPILYE